MQYLLEGQETERILFRNVNRSHFDCWLQFFKHPETSKHWIATDEAPQTACENWYKKQFHRYENGLGGMNALIRKSTGAFIGHCGLLVQTVDGKTELEIGYSLLPEFWNKGFASEAARKCRDFAFQNQFSESLISIISLTNTPSEKVARRNGMRIGKTTTYKGNRVNIYRITKKEWEHL